MSEQNLIDYKVTCKFGPAAAEVQRFSLVKGDNNNYELLHGKMSTLLKTSPFCLSWTDEEGDEVQIADEEALKIALKEQKGPLVKLTASSTSVVEGKKEADVEESSSSGFHLPAAPEFLLNLIGLESDSAVLQEIAKRAHEAAHKHAMENAKGGSKTTTVPGSATKVVSSSTTAGCGGNGATTVTVTSTSTVVPTKEAKKEGEEEEEKAVDGDSLQEIFNQLNANGADYLRQLGGMITNALETIDAMVAEGDEEEAPKSAEEEAKKPKEESEEDEWTVLKNKKEEEENSGDLTGLETLIKMGFTDEGGWLTQLLAAKGGDVTKVLATLQPDKKHQD